VVGRLSPTLVDSALLFLTMLGCYVAISALSYDDQREATAKEAPMKVTKMVHMQKIAKLGALGILNTVASIVAATSG
jgi:hypothetical protein